MELVNNPLRRHGLHTPAELTDKQVSTNAAKVLDLLQHCPVAQQTPLIDSPEIAGALGVGKVYLKDERERMGLGSFKASGAAYVIASAAAEIIQADPDMSLDNISAKQLHHCLNGKTYVCASAGNHGLSVAAGAKVFGARAVIYLSETVPESFAERLRSYDAEVVRAGAHYEASMAAAAARAADEGWILLSDSSWPGYTSIPTQVMEGYLVVAAEICQQIPHDPQHIPTHIFLQAGVGGIAAATTAYLRREWGDEPVIVVVEPDAAPALTESIKAGKPVLTSGPASDMGRLDCKEPSQIALHCLAREADWFVTISDARVLATVDWLNTQGISTTSSAAAGLAVVQQSRDNEALRARLGLTADSRILAIITEQA
jgi:diaminopropionate ammonia-lyase